MKVVVAPTGVANLASVRACFKRLGADVTTASSVDDAASADRLVLPGVGAFGAAAQRLADDGVKDVIRERVADGRPTMAICVGMQLLAESSEETPSASGLGVISEKVTAFDGGLRVPQLGWNRVEAGPDCRYVTDGWAYFANSYRLVSAPPSWTVAVTVYGSPFVSALERGDVLACQFHPELSGAWGASVVGRWLDGTGGAR